METFQLFNSRSPARSTAVDPQIPHATYRGLKGDEALIAEIAARLADGPYRIQPVLEVAAGVLAEWRANGWWPDPLDPICGALGNGQIG